MTTKTKKWIKPELTIFARTDPEETLLAACKSGGADGPQPANTSKWGKCNQGDTGQTGAVHCSELVKS